MSKENFMELVDELEPHIAQSPRSPRPALSAAKKVKTGDQLNDVTTKSCCISYLKLLRERGLFNPWTFSAISSIFWFIFILFFFTKSTRASAYITIVNMISKLKQ